MTAEPFVTGDFNGLVAVDPHPDSIALCWSCERPIKDGDGRTKDGWFVHQLCPTPTVEVSP
jgi:hypothetical protein